jgi:hypothetical protein
MRPLADFDFMLLIILAAQNCTESRVFASKQQGKVLQARHLPDATVSTVPGLAKCTTVESNATA